MTQPLLPASRYVSFSKADFEQALTDAGITQLRETEPCWTTRGHCVGILECRYRGQIPGLKGYVLIGSSVSPIRELAAANSCGSITLTFISGSNKHLKRLRRIKNWRTTLGKVVEYFKTFSFQPVAIPAES